MSNKKKILIIGGGGLLGSTIAKLFIDKGYRVSIVSLDDNKSKKRIFDKGLVNKLTKEYWVDAFLPIGTRDRSSKNSHIKINDYFELKPSLAFKYWPLYKIIKKAKPEIIIDAINSATYFSNFVSYYSKIFKKNDNSAIGLAVKLLSKHYQLLSFSSTELDIKHYIKIGTTGIGGMGLNLPFTHGEERPGKKLLLKVCFAGMETMLLFGLRNNKSMKVSEIKPAAAIFENEAINKGNIGAKDNFFDGGESGDYSLAEYELITGPTYMGLVTPLQIAHVTHSVVEDDNKFNVLDGLERAVIRTNKVSRIIRNSVVRKKIQVPRLISGNLGPPQLTKVLIEYELSKVVNLGKASIKLLTHDTDLFTQLNLVNFGLIMPDGKKYNVFRNGTCLYKNNVVKKYWVDLRKENIVQVKKVMSKIHTKIGPKVVSNLVS